MTWGLRRVGHPFEQGAQMFKYGNMLYQGAKGHLSLKIKDLTSHIISNFQHVVASKNYDDIWWRIPSSL